MIFTDGLSLEDFEDELSYMAHLWRISSGLPYEVLIDYDGKNRPRPNNSPRIMICLDRTQYDFVPISIDKEKPVALIECEIPEFEMIADWIKENYDILMRHWNNEISDYEALVALKRKTVNPADNSLEKKLLQEMLNVSKRRTGLPYDILLDWQGHSSQLCYNMPNLRVVVDGNEIPVFIYNLQPAILINAKIPKFREISVWIKEKYPILMMYWKREIDDETVVKLLKK
ncbi:MAG: hypothetical protein IJ575_07325 [Selenomonadaceae bacterium]|nr:hypothetical protein [Selenomonadaceae bacterium]